MVVSLAFLSGDTLVLEQSLTELERNTEKGFPREGRFPRRQSGQSTEHTG